MLKTELNSKNTIVVINPLAIPVVQGAPLLTPPQKKFFLQLFETKANDKFSSLKQKKTEMSEL